MKFFIAADPNQLVEECRVGKYLIKVYVMSDEVRLQARGFSIRFPEKPNGPKEVQDNLGPASALLQNPEDVAELEILGRKWQSMVAERIRKDWGQKHFQPDKKGRYLHPFFPLNASQFSCSHCGDLHEGKDVASNLWHCPSPACNGAPTDIGIPRQSPTSAGSGPRKITEIASKKPKSALGSWTLNKFKIVCDEREFIIESLSRPTVNYDGFYEIVHESKSLQIPAELVKEIVKLS